MSLPDPPNLDKTNIRPVAQVSSLTFWWSTPTTFDTNPATSFVLSTNNLFFNIPSTFRSYTVSSLSDGVPYSFFIASSNAAGIGASAAFRTVVPGLKPSPPDNPTYSTLSTNLYNVRWQVSSSGSLAPVLGYVVGAWPVDPNGNTLGKGNSLYPRVKIGVEGSNTSSVTLFASTISSFNYKFIVQTVNDPGYAVQSCVTPIAYNSSIVGRSFSTLNNLKAWYDASGTSNFFLSPTSSVLAWYDRSGSGRHALAGANAPLCSTTSNNAPTAVLFSTPQAQSMILPRGTLSPLDYQYDMYMVIKTTSTGTKGLLTSGSNSGAGLNQLSLSTASIVQNWGPGGEFRSPSSFGTPAKQLIRAGYTGNTRITQVFTNTIDNGSNANTGAISTFINISTNTTARNSFAESTLMGVTVGNQNYYNGSIHEVMIFDRYLPTSETNLITSYLWNKWMKAPVSPFVPTDLPGLYAWYDPLQFSGSPNGSNITTWTNSVSGNPSLVGVGQISTLSTGLSFNSTGVQILSTQIMSSFGSNVAFSSFTFAMVSRGLPGSGTATGGASYLVGTRFSGGSLQSYGYAHRGGTATAMKKTAWLGYRDFINAPFLPPTDCNIDILTFNRSTLGSGGAVNGVVWMNYYASSMFLSTGVTAPSGTFISDATSINNRFNSLALNPTFSPTNAPQGVFGDLIVYSTNLSVTDYQKVEGYLLWKWNQQTNAQVPISFPHRATSTLLVSFNSNW